MPTFTSEDGRTYEVDGRYFIWHPDTWEDEEPLPDIRIPLRIKLGVVLRIAETGSLSDNRTMRETLAAIVPAAEPVMGEMDVNDFREMFSTWLSTYNALTGASLGESSPSAVSSSTTEARPSTTSGNGSASRSTRSASRSSGAKRAG